MGLIAVVATSVVVAAEGDCVQGSLLVSQLITVIVSSMVLLLGDRGRDKCCVWAF